MRTKSRMLAFICLYLVGAVAVHAQQKGQYVPGQYGLNAGVLPDPGITYANLTINYSADTLKGRNGNTVPLTGSYDIWAVANVVYYVPKFKLMGAKVAFMAAPTFANGSPYIGLSEFPEPCSQRGRLWACRYLGAARHYWMEFETRRGIRGICVHGPHRPLLARRV